MPPAAYPEQAAEKAGFSQSGSFQAGEPQPYTHRFTKSLSLQGLLKMHFLPFPPNLKKIIDRKFRRCWGLLEMTGEKDLTAKDKALMRLSKILFFS